MDNQELHCVISDLCDQVHERDAEIERLRKIESAARNLIDQRGRHNTEIAYRRLETTVKGE